MRSSSISSLNMVKISSRAYNSKYRDIETDLVSFYTNKRNVEMAQAPRYISVVTKNAEDY